jgi:glycosyltransferase 2 family protein
VKRHLQVFGLVAGLVVTALFVVYVVRTLRGHDLSVYATPHAVLGIVFATLCWLAGVPLMALAWRGMLGGLGVRRSRRELIGILGVTQFAKYVPGNVSQYIGRVGMSLARGIPARALAATIILETLLIIAAAVTVGVASGLLSGVGLTVVRHHGAQLGLIGALVAVAIAGLFGFRAIAPRMLRSFAPKYAPALDGTLLPTQSSLVRAFIMYCVAYGAVGAGLILLGNLLLPHAQQDDWLLIAAFSLSWVVGFVTPGAPAGLGVRESLLLLMLAPVYSPAAASVLVIALRIATTLGDLTMFATGWVLLPRKPRVMSGTPNRT